MIPAMLQKQAEGFDIVNMTRSKQQDARWKQRLTSKLFYKLLNRLSDVQMAENGSDFFLISQRVASILRNDYRERTRFLRGLIQLVGFGKTCIEYQAPLRFAGKSKYSFFKLLRLSFSAIASFSKLPLQLGIFTGLIFGLISIILIIYSIVMWLLETPVSGYTTTIVFLSAFAGIQLFVTGIIGMYIGNLFDEAKARPIYTVDKTCNI
jgi:dolichol-phosphate mannosyltransferase